MQSLKLFSLLTLLALTSFSTAQSSHAFLWSKTAGMQDLGTLGGSQSLAFGINASAEVVGTSFIARRCVQRAFKWIQGTGMEDLGTLSGYDSSVALGVNTFGQIAGYVHNSADNQVTRAVLWSANGTIQDLGTLGGTSSIANGINDASAVTGYSNPTQQHVYLCLRLDRNPRHA